MTMDHLNFLFKSLSQTGCKVQGCKVVCVLNRQCCKQTWGNKSIYVSSLASRRVGGGFRRFLAASFTRPETFCFLFPPFFYPFWNNRFSERVVSLYPLQQTLCESCLGLTLPLFETGSSEISPLAWEKSWQPVFRKAFQWCISDVCSEEISVWVWTWIWRASVSECRHIYMFDICM